MISARMMKDLYVGQFHIESKTQAAATIAVQPNPIFLLILFDFRLLSFNLHPLNVFRVFLRSAMVFGCECFIHIIFLSLVVFTGTISIGPGALNGGGGSNVFWKDNIQLNDGDSRQPGCLVQVDGGNDQGELHPI